MTLNEVMPDYDVREYHQTFIRASCEDVRILLLLRAGGKPAESVWNNLLLSDVLNKEVVLGRPAGVAAKFRRRALLR